MVSSRRNSTGGHVQATIPPPSGAILLSALEQQQQQQPSPILERNPDEDSSSLTVLPSPPPSGSIQRKTSNASVATSTTSNIATTTTTTMAATPTREKSKARKALRSVGRRLTGRFSKQQRNNYGAVVIDDSGGGEGGGQLAATLAQDNDEEEGGEGDPASRPLLSASSSGRTNDNTNTASSSAGKTILQNLSDSVRGLTQAASGQRRRRMQGGGGGDGNESNQNQNNFVRSTIGGQANAATTPSSPPSSSYDDYYEVERTVVARFEGFLRLVFLLSLSFFLGTSFSLYQDTARQVLEYVAVSWSTAALLYVAIKYEKHIHYNHRHHHQTRQQHQPQGEVGCEKEENNAIEDDEDEDSLLIQIEEGMPLLPSSNEQQGCLQQATPPPSMCNDAEHNPAAGHEGFEIHVTNAEGGGSSLSVVSTPVDGNSNCHNNCPETVLTNSANSANDHQHNTLGADTSIHSALFLPPATPAAASQTLLQPQVQLPHPSLESLYITDAMVGRRVNMNDAKRLHVMDTDYFLGHMMIMIRTPDVDDPSGGSDFSNFPDNTATAEYLRGKQRRFEFQFQGKLKKLPTGRLYFACELEQSIKLGMIQRAFVGAAMAFVKSSNPFFHYSISGDSSTGEPPHMAFPFLEGMNVVVATPPGQPPPLLGQVIKESAESQKKRKKGGQSFDWNLQDTYTFSLWSAYVDFLTWKVLNLPGIRPFGLTSVLGLQPIRMTVYEMEEKQGDGGVHDENGGSGAGNKNSNKEPHVRQDSRTLVRLELCHSEITRFGPATTQALAKSDAEPALEATSLPVAESPLPALEVVLSGDGAPAAVVEQEPVPDDGVPAALVDQEPATIGNASRTSQEVESDEETEEEEAAAELGEGIYIRSGDPIVIREVVDNDDASASSSVPSPPVVAMGGGFCVLQEQDRQQPGYTLVIEKANKRRTRRDRGGGSALIKNGDTVFFKLVKGDSAATMYLSIHRGWWLKWVAVAPTKNGHFTIHTDQETDDPHRQEGQSSYLTVGGSFWLQHKRWSKFSVGVASEGSATYGGRLLGLYKAGTSGLPPAAPTPQPASLPRIEDDGLDEDDFAETPETSKALTQWMKPVLFRAFEGGGATTSTSAPPVPPDLAMVRSGSEDNLEASISSTNHHLLRFSDEDARIDAPVWIELMHRTERVRHFAFVVRVIPPETDETASPAFVRIRTGRDLAEVMRVGQNWRNRVDTPSPARRRHLSKTGSDGGGSNTRAAKMNAYPSFNTSSGQINPSGDASGTPASPSRKRTMIDPTATATSSPGEDDDDEVKEILYVDSDAESHDDGDYAYMDDEGANVDTADTSTELHHKRKRPPRKFIVGSLARGASAVVKASKGTVSAGKSLVPIRPKNPPAKEPNQKVSSRSRRRTERELHVAVSRGMKRMDRSDSNQYSSESPAVIAGELSAPEKSCRSVSNMLFKMSGIKRSSQYYTSFNSLLNAQINHSSDHDDSFLHGKAIDLGVSPDKKNGKTITGCVIARCLWEGHWREEWCGLYERTIMFFSPLTDTPNLELSLADIQSSRKLDIGSYSPLPGLPILVLETAWQCYYLAFINEELRRKFNDKLESAKNAFEEKAALRQQQSELWEARFWQGFRSSFEASLMSGGKGKWAEITLTGNRKKRRVVLNNRKMAFDLAHFPDSTAAFVEDLLSQALSFRLDSLKEHPEELVRFLDATSQLQNFPLRHMDLTTPDAFCIFINLYHCLLQHALLLTVNGPLTKRSCGHFMRTSCYEIGGDVFSLAELNLFVIRGRMSRPVAPKPPFYDALRKSNTYGYYALGFTSPLVNFCLHTGNVSNPREICIYSLSNFYEQLSESAAAFVRQNVVLDESKRIVYIPRVCDVFRLDFAESGSIHSCLRFCLGFLEEDIAAKIQGLVKDSAVSVKYQPISDQYYSTLKLAKPHSEKSTLQRNSSIDT